MRYCEYDTNDFVYKKISLLLKKVPKTKLLHYIRLERLASDKH
jgi:hypothetical protein